MKNRRLSILTVTITFALLAAGILIPLPWLARESLFEFTARQAKAEHPAIDTPPSDIAMTSEVDVSWFK